MSHTRTQLTLKFAHYCNILRTYTEVFSGAHWWSFILQTPRLDHLCKIPGSTPWTPLEEQLQTFAG